MTEASVSFELSLEFCIQAPLVPGGGREYYNKELQVEGDSCEGRFGTSFGVLAEGDL